MDRITSANLATFQQEQSMSAGINEATLFEHFVNYCVVSESFDNEFNVNEVHTGGGDDLGIDGLAILVNGVIVESVDAAAELLKFNNHLDVRFIFNQAKTSSGFSGEQIVTFGEGVLEFFSEDPTLPMAKRVRELRAIMSWLYEQSNSFKRGRPACELNFVTTGQWVDDRGLTAVIGKLVARIRATNLFDEVTLRPWGASEIQASWSRSKNSITANFSFVNKATLVDIQGVTESYIGVLPLSEFLKIISSPTTGLHKSIFVDNVRDYQGDTSVNEEMAESLKSVAGRDRFAVLNNGVTLVARSLGNVGNKFTVSDYQIVNGCQTSHVLYNNRDTLPEDMQVPVKVISTNDEDVIGAIATATNRQTLVTEEDLFALLGFQKNLEKYMASFPQPHQLYYERRSKQYGSVTGIEKVRIITKQIEIRAFGAMFLNEAHRAARYYGSLKEDVGSKIFNPEHKLDPYYTAAFAYYKLEFFFRSGAIPVSYKPARYHLLMAFRHLAAGKEMFALTANKIVGYSNIINEELWDDTKAIGLFRAACEAVDSALGGSFLDGDQVKVQAFTDKVLAEL